MPTLISLRFDVDKRLLLASYDKLKIENNWQWNTILGRAPVNIMK